MWKAKNQNSSDNPASFSNETSTKSKIKALFGVRSRPPLPISDPASRLSSTMATDSRPPCPSTKDCMDGVDPSLTTGISANVPSVVQQTPPLITTVSDSGLSDATSTGNVYSAIMFGDTSQRASSGSRIIRSMAYQGLKMGLEAMKNFAGPFPPLGVTIEGLLQIIQVFETAQQNDEDRATMIFKLTAIVDLLNQKLHQKSTPSLSSSFIGRVERLKRSLDTQIGLTKERMKRARFRHIMDGKRDSREIAVFQNVLLHAFDVFLIDSTLETELNVEEILTNQLFQSLPRATNAAYNSASDVPRNGCTTGTREEILKKLMSWATDETNKKIYWLNGMAGTGKTTIAYSFCQRLEEGELLGASFFCSRSDDDSSDTRRIFPTIAYELSQHLPAAYSANLLDSIRKDHNVGTKRLDLQFSKLIVDPMMVIPSEFRPSFAKIIVVLDALDECKNQDEVATILFLLSRHAANLPIKFFITSRPTPEIEDEFRRSTLILSKFLLHEVERDMVEADICLYVKDRFKRIATRKLVQEDGIWPSEEETMVIVERAGVLFIYAATICSHVGDGHREGVKSRLQEVISSFSGDISRSKDRTYDELDDLYRNILDAAYKGKNIKEMEDIKNVLHIVVASRHPLSARAIGELLKVDTTRVFTALSKLHSVISVGEESVNNADPIAPIHASFPDFLGNNERAGKHYLSPNESQMTIAKFCLRMIQDVLVKDNVCGFNDGYAINDQSEARVDVKKHISDGLEYACTYWVSHVTELATPDVLKGELMEIFNSRVLRWIECMSLIGKLDVAVKSLWKLEVRIQTNAELHYAIRDGRRFLLQNLEILRAYPLETYHSGLVWLPKKSRIRRMFPRVKKWEVVCGLEETWDACESVLKGHTNLVRSVAFSHNGNRVVSGSYDTTISIWNVETSEEEMKLECHSSVVRSVAFSHDGKKVVSGSDDTRVRIWNVETGEEERELEGHSSMVTSVAFSCDGKKVVSGSDDTTIRIWNVETGNEERKFEGHSYRVGSIALSHDGKVVSGSDDRTIRIWDVKTGELERKLEGHTSMVTSVAFSHDGKKVVSGSDDATIRIWNVETGEEERKLEGHLGTVESVVFSYDGKKMVSGSHDNTIRIWNVETGKEERKLEGHSSMVGSVAFSNDGKVVSGSYDNTVRIWNVETEEEEILRKLEGHSDRVRSVAYSHDKKMLVSGSFDATISIWNVETGEEERKLEGHSSRVRSVAFSYNGKKVVSGSYDDTIRVWNAETGKEEQKFEGHSSIVESVVFSHDGKKVVSGSDDTTIRIWNVETGEEERRLEGHSTVVQSVAFSHDGKKIVSGSFDTTIRIWNVETGEEERKLEGHSCVIESVAFSHDGKKVVSGSGDNTIRIWNVETGEEEKKLEGHSSVVGSVIFSHDGTKVISGSDDRTIRIWNVETDESMDNENSSAPLTIYKNWITSKHSTTTHNLWLPTRYQDFVMQATAESAICLAYATGQVVILRAI